MNISILIESDISVDVCVILRYTSVVKATKKSGVL